MTSLLTEGLVADGHQVTLFATGTSRTRATLHAEFARGYSDDPTMWPWEAYEMFNIASAVERADQFDLIHVQAMYSPLSLPFSRLTATPVVQTIHHAPTPSEVALWRRYPEAPFIAISREQARLMPGLNVVGVVPHGIDMSAFAFRPEPEDYLVFLGRFTDGKGVLQAIEIAAAAGMRLLMAAAPNDYYRDVIAPHVDGKRVVYVGEVDHAQKVALLGGARGLLYPVQAGEPFGIVLIEAMACGTPVAALDRGAVREIVEEGLTGGVFASETALKAGLAEVLALDRRQVRMRAMERFGAARMVDEYLQVYGRLLAERRVPISQP